MIETTDALVFTTIDEDFIGRAVRMVGLLDGDDIGGAMCMVRVLDGDVVGGVVCMVGLFEGDTVVGWRPVHMTQDNDNQ